MQFTIKKQEFVRGLKLSHSIADKKSTMPMLANVLLRTQGKNKLLVAATDLTVSISAELASKNKASGEGITLGAKALHDIVCNLPGDTITVKKTQNNWAEITSGRVKYKLVGMADRDFPKLPDHRETKLEAIESQSLKKMFDSTLFSVCNDETRFHLNGILFESTGKMTKMVSTDGHRLSKIEEKMKGAPKLSGGIIIPKKGVIEIRRLIDQKEDCKVAIKSPYMFVQAEGIVLAVKLIESQFPPYEQVIPKKNTKKMAIDRHLLLDALKRSQLMSSETRGVKFSLSKDLLTVASDNPDMGEVKEELDASYTGDDISMGFNPKYIIDLLSQMSSDQVFLELGGELDPGLLRPSSDDDYLGVIMPMRI